MNTLNTITYIETNKIKNPEILSKVIFNNFIYLTHFPDLQHNKQEITRILQLNDGLYFLVYDNSVLIGYLVGDFREFPDGRYGYYISYVYISEYYRNKKIGSTLMDMLIKNCREREIKFILLTCDTNDKKVVDFYKKYGFSVDSTFGENKRHNVYSLYLE